MDCLRAARRGTSFDARALRRKPKTEMRGGGELEEELIYEPEREREAVGAFRTAAT